MLAAATLARDEASEGRRRTDQHDVARGNQAYATANPSCASVGERCALGQPSASDTGTGTGTGATASDTSMGGAYEARAG